MVWRSLGKRACDLSFPKQNTREIFFIAFGLCSTTQRRPKPERILADCIIFSKTNIIPSFLLRPLVRWLHRDPLSRWWSLRRETPDMMSFVLRGTLRSPKYLVTSGSARRVWRPRPVIQIISRRTNTRLFADHKFTFEVTACVRLFDNFLSEDSGRGNRCR